MSEKDGYDAKAGWGNSSLRGHGVNSPAMMEARKGFAKAAKTKALKGKEIASGIEKSGGKVVRYEDVDKVNRMLLNSGEKHTYKHSPPGRTKLPKWSSYNK